jgi:guanine deaminase
MSNPPQREHSASAVRGHVITFSDDPFVSDRALTDIADALIVSEGGKIAAFGSYEDTLAAVPAGVEIEHHGGALICPGFVDTHAHYVQTPIVGAFGDELLAWLDNYAYPAEERVRDPHEAESVAAVYFDQLLANGTTTALTFCATFAESVDAFFEEAARRGMRMIGGKVLMDRNAPEQLCDSAQSGYEQSKKLIARWHGRGRALYAITPRFAPTSTPEQLELAGALWAESPGTFIHTHIAESAAEIALVEKLFPQQGGYLDVYDHYGLLGRRSVLAHGVHLSETERARLRETETALAHCPTSNLFLGSGLFDMGAAKQGGRQLHVGLGTDIGAGTSFSLLATMGEAYKVGQLRSFTMSAQKLFYLATLGGARALALDELIGSIAIGREADFVVLDPTATPLLAYRSAAAESTEEIMFLLAALGDDRAVAATYVGGTRAYVRKR